MSTSRTEVVPATWDDARDVPFFRITHRVFTPRFCAGASLLLAGNDDEGVLLAAGAAGRGAAVGGSRQTG